MYYPAIICKPDLRASWSNYLLHAAKVHNKAIHQATCLRISIDVKMSRRLLVIEQQLKIFIAYITTCVATGAVFQKHALPH